MTIQPAESSVDPIRTAIGELSEPALLVAASVHPLDSMVTAALEDRTPHLRLLSSKRALNAVFDEFIVASRTAQAVARDELEIRSVDTIPDQNVIISEDHLTLLLTVGKTVKAVDTAEQPFVGKAHGHFIERWVAGADYTLTTPPISRVRSSLRDEFDEAILRDFDEMIEAAAGTDLGIVDGCLLIAAIHRELLYDIGTWGENIGIASRATFSRGKARLERQGVIGTEKVHVEIGRPRQRLKLGDSRLDGLSIAELVRTADDLRSGNVRGASLPA